MTDEPGYVFAQAEDEQELRRLRSIEAWLDPFTVRHLETIGVRPDWRCLDVGAGAGSIARWLAEHAGANGSVVAVDMDTRYFTDLPLNVEVRRQELTSAELEADAYDLVHARGLLQHLPDPGAGLAQIAASVAPGGWLLVEEGDLGGIHLSGPPAAADATKVFHDLRTRWDASGVIHSRFGRDLPGLVKQLGFDNFSVDAVTGIGSPGDPEYETVRLAWPRLRSFGAAVGISEADLMCLEEVFESPSTLMVSVAVFAAWGRRPR